MILNNASETPLKLPAGSLMCLTATVTATSADDGCGTWAVRVAVLAEGVAQGVDGLALEPESDVGVDAGRHANVGVAQKLLDHDEVDALLQEQSGGRMAEVVKSDAAEAGLAEERDESAGEVGRVDRSTLRSGEHVPVVLPRGARGRTLALLLFVLELQRVAAEGGEGDTALGGPRLGGQRGEPACGGAVQGSADGGGARVEVEVFPAQAEEFALAESGVEGEFEQRVQRVVLGGGEELPGFVGGERFEASGAWGAGADVAGDVARDLFLSDGVLQGGLEDGVDVGERHGGHIWAVRGLPYECPGVRGALR